MTLTAFIPPQVEPLVPVLSLVFDACSAMTKALICTVLVAASIRRPGEQVRCPYFGVVRGDGVFGVVTLVLCMQMDAGLVPRLVGLLQTPGQPVEVRGAGTQPRPALSFVHDTVSTWVIASSQQRWRLLRYFVRHSTPWTTLRAVVRPIRCRPMWTVAGCLWWWATCRTPTRRYHVSTPCHANACSHAA